MSANDRCSRPRKILIICQYFVPYAASVGVVARVVHLARFLNDCGCEVHILTSDGADFGDLGLGDFLSELNITYLSDPLKKSVRNVSCGLEMTPTAQPAPDCPCCEP